MECPVCGEKLREIEKFGVMVDLCPGCKGCWLDRGEIEKIAAAEEGGSGVVSSDREAGGAIPPIVRMITKIAMTTTTMIIAKTTTIVTTAVAVGAGAAPAPANRRNAARSWATFSVVSAANDS